jgi:ssDNA thymidine ADP-ribosyltransferase, DarT
MADIDPLKNIALLYHFTDRRNLPLIREHGGLYPMSELRQKKIEIPAPGGNEWSRDADGLKGMDAYVHLCFRNTHPMEYRARNEGRIGDTIFLQIHPDVLTWGGVKFTPDVANKAGVQTHTMEEARKLIDFEVLYTRTNWSDAKIQARLQQAEKYEIIVPHKIPLELIRNLPNG